MFKCLVREVTKWFEWTAFYLLQMPDSHLNMLLSCQKHRCINVECSTWQNDSLKYSSQYIFFKNKQVKMQHMQSLRHSWNTSRQKYLSLFPCNSKLLSMNQYVLLSFILYSHSCTRWNSNEMSLVQELQFHYAESTLYASAIHLFYNACWACPIYSVQHPCTCLQACIEFTCSHEWGKTLVMKANNRTYSYSKPSL